MAHREDPVVRFWRYVDKSGDCWIWTGGRVRNYGAFKLEAGKQVKAHRFAYALLVGPIPDGLPLDHLCRNPPCVNPKHLEPVTHAENLRRSDVAPATVNSRKTHCAQGHEYDGGNVRWTKDGKHRYCLACRREWNKQRRLMSVRVEIEAMTP